jgi:hypothetical protein
LVDKRARLVGDEDGDSRDIIRGLEAQSEARTDNELGCRWLRGRGCRICIVRMQFRSFSDFLLRRMRAGIDVVRDRRSMREENEK